MEWTASQEAQLRELWEAGHSMAAIGVKMGVSKNAIAGKRNRMGLTERASPINAAARSGQAAKRRAENLAAAQRMHGQGYSSRQIGAQLGMRPEAVGALLRGIGLQGNGRRALSAGAGLDVVPAAARVPAVRPPPPPPVVVVPVAAHPLMRGARVGCRWPLGEPRQPGFRYCDAADVVPGKPYCLEHCCKAYQSPYVSATALAPRGWAA
jgi:GcrA cell cycle regulator